MTYIPIFTNPYNKMCKIDEIREFIEEIDGENNRVLGIVGTLRQFY